MPESCKGNMWRLRRDDAAAEWGGYNEILQLSDMRPAKWVRLKVRESGGTVRLARLKFDSPSSANTYTVETTMLPGLHRNLPRF